jgi:C-terminal processing protease CtpA/Prc
MRSRLGGLWVGVVAVLSVAIIAGSWLVQRGILFAPAARPASSSELFAQVYARVRTDYVDTLADSALYAAAATGAVAELDDPTSAYVPRGVLSHNPDTLARIAFGVVSDSGRRGVARLQALGAGRAYLPLAHLTDAAIGDFQRTVDSLERGGLRDLVVDLRGTTDGSAAQAVSIARSFLSRGQVILRVRGRRTADSAAYSASAPERWPGLRVALLADSTTAGAAEVVCGALQDHDRATIVGSRTAGIGGTPTVFHLQQGGALALRTGAWFTPAGRPIQVAVDRQADSARKAPTVRSDAGRKLVAGGGITPDVVVTATVPGGHPTPTADPVVRAALSALARTTA